ncbi:MAG: PIN domain-containing protein [Pyrinomonadaceae bacterium]|nr:PIN domain-containing protein [Pyrinomonadaceae bacterium]
MDIKALPEGTRCLVDANIFIYHLAAASPDCTSFIDRLAAGHFHAHVTTVVVAEVLHRRMMAEALAKGVVTSGQLLKKLKADSALITQLSDYVAEVEDLLLLPLEVIEVAAADISASHTLRRKHGLFVNDSINLACAERFGLTDIVTHDADFGRAPGARVWSPTDI